MQERTWLTHPVFTSYEVSDDGLVRSIPRRVPNRWGTTNQRVGRLLRTFIRAGGYLGGNLSVDGQRVNFDVHKMVCETFHGLKPDETMEVRHLNGDRLDNRADNLAWGTKSENMMDRVRHGTHPTASRTHCSHGHPYTEANTYRTPNAPNKRRCRACDRARDLARPSRRR